jgi:hypothetical protein
MGLDYFKKEILNFIVEGSPSPHTKEQGVTGVKACISVT